MDCFKETYLEFDSMEDAEEIVNWYLRWIKDGE
jgi:hypothetical protein